MRDHPDPTVAAELGLPDDARLVIVECAELGFCHAANVGVFDALRSGGATSAALMVPAPWARQAAAQYRGEDVGVQLALNAEHDLYRWGPITQAPSLLDGDGGFPRTVTDLWDHADLDEVRRECRAQIERAVLWGFDVSHLASHLDAMLLRPEFFDIYLDLAVEFRLPIRAVTSEVEGQAGFPIRALAADEGVRFADAFATLPDEGGTTSRRLLAETLASLEPGVTELWFRPATDSPELRAMSPDWEQRVDDHVLLADERGVAELFEQAGVTAIGYRTLRDVMRRGS
ncbi:MAG: ChbG/HpnK family deacetylase [Actinomycetota bacterium]|jgi:predicted glycoside hydrolase/deacetylase ChbG (UPF0249 family)|nr:ChbG/HpnK family deacetylase [Actinomycetota bacterium]